MSWQLKKTLSRTVFMVFMTASLIYVCRHTTVAGPGTKPQVAAPRQEPWLNAVAGAENTATPMGPVYTNYIGEDKNFERPAGHLQAAKVYAPPSVSDPAIAIVIDDIGSEWKKTPQLLQIGGDITYSILPGAGFTDRAREAVSEAGREIMIHIPMQKRAGRRYKPTTTVLWKYMELENIDAVMRRDIEAIPEAVGANNHMGAWFTKWRPGMEIVLGELKKHNMFFVDSVTANHQFSYELAIQMGMKSYPRDTFLDYRNHDSYVEAQLRFIIDVAKKTGRALAIGHPRSATLRVLAREIPRLNEYGVRLVPASVIVDSRPAGSLVGAR